MIKVILFLLLISNMILSIENSDQVEIDTNKIDKLVLEFYKKNRNPICDFNIDEKIKKVKLVYNGNIYTGFLSEKKPYGKWISENNFSVECYLSDKKFFKINNSKSLEYYDNEGFFYENKEDGYTNLYVNIILEDKKYNRKYKIENGEIILLNRDIELYKKGWIKVEDILNVIFTKNSNFAKIIYQE